MASPIFAHGLHRILAGRGPSAPDGRDGRCCDQRCAEQRQFHVQFQDDPVAVACRHITGLSTIVWGNDYPHAEGTFRGSRELIAKQFADVPADERAAMLGGDGEKALAASPDDRRGHPLPRGRYFSEAAPESSWMRRAMRALSGAEGASFR